MSNDQYILKHYEKVAKNFGLKAESSIQDPYIREKEIEFFLGELQKKFLPEDSFSLLEIGPGNGLLLSLIGEYFPNAKLTGIEFSPDLIKLAEQRNILNAKLVSGDIRDQSYFQEKFDVVISERVLINLLSKRHQYNAIKNISECLHPGGLFLMSESFKESWLQLNSARREIQLSEIEQSKHNLYLTQATLKHIQDLGLVSRPHVMGSHYLSTHFYLSRVFYPLVKEHGRKKDPHLLRFFNAAFPPGVGQYSPIQLHKFEKP